MNPLVYCKFLLIILRFNSYSLTTLLLVFEGKLFGRSFCYGNNSVNPVKSLFPKLKITLGIYFSCHRYNQVF